MNKQVENAAENFVQAGIARYGTISTLSRARMIVHEYRPDRVPQWLTRSIEILSHRVARQICETWVARIGLGFHPDTSADQYDPPLSAEWRSEYDHDMNWLFGLDLDPYRYAIEATEKNEQQIFKAFANPDEALPLLKVEFPDFPVAELPRLPDGFEDNSWHNDACPNFINKDLRLVLFIDRAAPAHRETPDMARFTLQRVDDDACHSGNPQDTLLMTDDWQRIIDRIKQEQQQ